MPTVITKDRARREDPHKSFVLSDDFLQRHYSGTWLLKPEELFLRTYGSELGSWRMLDIGVGTGRTTLHFAHRVAHYIGVDFNTSMLDACRRNFPHLRENLIKCDAQSMERFPDASFDFVLFSWGGLDYLPPDGRLTALREIRRVGKNGGLFLFSSHNLNSVDRLLRLRTKLSRNPRRLFAGLLRFAVLKATNASARRLKGREFAMVYDAHGMFDQKLSWFFPSIVKGIGYLYYIKPSVQIRQLQQLGFRDVRAFTEEGREIASAGELDLLPDFHIHYCCRM